MLGSLSAIFHLSRFQYCRQKIPKHPTTLEEAKAPSAQQEGAPGHALHLGGSHHAGDPSDGETEHPTQSLGEEAAAKRVVVGSGVDVHWRRRGGPP